MPRSRRNHNPFDDLFPRDESTREKARGFLRAASTYWKKKTREEARSFVRDVDLGVLALTLRTKPTLEDAAFAVFLFPALTRKERLEFQDMVYQSARRSA